MGDKLITFFTYIKEDYFLIGAIISSILFLIIILTSKKIHPVSKILSSVAIIGALAYTYIIVMNKYEDQKAREMADKRVYHYNYLQCDGKPNGEVKHLHKEFTKSNPLSKEEMDTLDKQTDICWKIESIQQGWHIATISRGGLKKKEVKKTKTDKRIEEVICSYYSHICWPHRDSHHTCVMEPELCQYPHLVDDTPLTREYYNNKMRESEK